MCSQRQHNRSTAGQYARGVRFYHQGRHAQAIAELDPLIGAPSAQGQLARYYAGMARRAEGIEALQSGDFTTAEQFFKTAMDQLGRNADLTGYMASLFARTGRYERCVEQMEHLREIRDDDVTVCRRLAQAQWRAGRRVEAVMTLTAGLRRLESCGPLHLQLGLFYAAEERWPEARCALQSAVDADCTDDEAHYYLGLSAAADGDVDAAVSSLSRAMALRSDDLLLAWQLALAARTAEAQGRRVIIHLPERHVECTSTSQVGQLAEYVAVEPDFVEAFLALPESPTDPEFFGMLRDVVRTALAKHPRYADLHYLCSRICQRLGRHREALAHVRRAVSINPTYCQALVHMGRLLAEKGRSRSALVILERAIAAGADWADVHYLTGELCRTCGRGDEARRHLQRALTLNVNFEQAAGAIASLAA